MLCLTVYSFVSISGMFISSCYVCTECTCVEIDCTKCNCIKECFKSVKEFDPLSLHLRNFWRKFMAFKNSKSLKNYSKCLFSTKKFCKIFEILQIFGNLSVHNERVVNNARFGIFESFWKFSKICPIGVFHTNREHGVKIKIF